MSEMLGREVTISIGGTVVAEARTKTLTINNTAVDISTDGDSGIQRILAKPGKKAVDLSVEGLTIDDTLLEFSLGDNLIEEVILDYGTFTLTGNFFQSSYSEGMPHEEAKTFSASYMSSGVLAKAATP